jgi:hypothetical protein
MSPETIGKIKTYLTYSLAIGGVIMLMIMWSESSSKELVATKKG